MRPKPPLSIKWCGHASVFYIRMKCQSSNKNNVLNCSRSVHLFHCLVQISIQLLWNYVFNMSTKNMKNRYTPIYITLYDVTGLRYKFIFNMSTKNMKNRYTPIYITLYDVTGLRYKFIFNMSTMNMKTHTHPSTLHCTMLLA
jgi:hypothetical protein